MRAGAWRWWVALAASLAFIGAFTLTPGRGPTATEATALLLDGQVGLQDFIANIALFLPLGLALGGLGVRPLPALLIACVLSFGVETIQLVALRGRDASAGDVLSNTLGGTLGAVVVEAAPLLLWPSRRAARWLAALGAAAGVSILVGTAWLCDLSTPGRSFLGQWSGGSWPGARPSALQVISTEANGVPIEWGKLKSADSLIHGVLERNVTIRVTGRVDTLQAAELTPRLVGVMEVAPAWGHQLFMLQRWGDDLLFIPRARAEDYLMRSPWIRLRHVFAPPVGDTVTIVARVEGNRWSLVARRGEREWSGSLNRVVAGWRLVVPQTLTPRGAEWAYTGLWLVLLAGPGVYWGWRGMRRQGVG